MKYKILSLPIETKNREFFGKLLLSAKAAEKGWLVFLGHHVEIRKSIANLLPGAHVEISIPEHKYRKFLLPFSRMGHKICNMCEESVTYYDGEDYCDRKVGKSALSVTEKFFATGARQADHVLNYRETSDGQVVPTGNCRFDILRPGLREVYAKKSERLRGQYGPFVLVNTNFSRCNPHPGYGDRLAGAKKKKVVTGAEQLALWQLLLEHKTTLIKEFMNVLPAIVENCKCNLVVRPHPSENFDTWKNWAEKYKNIFVIHEGSANEWMLAAEAVIHEGCTTGIEGFLLERPVIAYVPGPENKLLKNVANEVSFQVKNKKELLNAVDKAIINDCLDTDEDRQKKINYLKYYIENAGGPLACDRIVGEFDDLDVFEHSLDDILNNLRGIKYYRNQLMLFVKFLAKGGMSFFRSRNDIDAVVAQKFSGITPEELMEPLRIWSDHDFISSVPIVKQIKPNLFCIYVES